MPTEPMTPEDAHKGPETPEGWPNRSISKLLDYIDTLTAEHVALKAKCATLEATLRLEPHAVMKLIYPDGVSTPETYRHSWIENVMLALRRAAGLEA